MTPSIINAAEHRSFSFLPQMAAWFARARSKATKEEILGLHKTPQGVAPGNFFGAVHIGEGDSRAILCVFPKSEFTDMDYLKMFLGCAAHPVVGGHMGHCLDFWPEKPPIETDHAPDFCGLVAAAFLRELNDLCAHRLRRNFVREEANLVGKAKGKILSAENIRRNLSHGRAERVFCAYQSVSDDILENRILRAALEQVAVYLSGVGLFRDEQGTLERWVRSCRSHLRGVSVVRIRGGDFLAARSRGAFSHYRRPLHLARAVLESTGFDLDGVNGRASGVVPFALNSAELFERWAQVQLLESAEFLGLQAGYERSNTFAREGGQIAIRPDFWIRKKGENPAMILDAKYKSAPKNFKDVSQQDIYQMVAYSRHRAFLEKLHPNAPQPENESVELALLYPQIGEGGDVEIVGEKDKSFHAPLSVWMIPCPEKSAIAEEDRAAA